MTDLRRALYGHGNYTLVAPFDKYNALIRRNDVGCLQHVAVELRISPVARRALEHDRPTRRRRSCAGVDLRVWRLLAGGRRPVDTVLHLDRFDANTVAGARRRLRLQRCVPITLVVSRSQPRRGDV